MDGSSAGVADPQEKAWSDSQLGPSRLEFCQAAKRKRQVDRRRVSAVAQSSSTPMAHGSLAERGKNKDGLINSEIGPFITVE